MGVTRAEEDLTLSFAEHRTKWGRKQKSFPSRFLYELYGQAQKAEAVHQAFLADEAKRKARRFRHAGGGREAEGTQADQAAIRQSQVTQLEGRPSQPGTRLAGQAAGAVSA